VHTLSEVVFLSTMCGEVDKLSDMVKIMREDLDERINSYKEGRKYNLFYSVKIPSDEEYQEIINDRKY